MAKYSKRKWLHPRKRAKQYATDRKSGVDRFGTPLGAYNKGLRSGYLLAQSDSAGLYRYKKAILEGKTKKKARDYSRKKG